VPDPVADPMSPATIHDELVAALERASLAVLAELEREAMDPTASNSVRYQARRLILDQAAANRARFRDDPALDLVQARLRERGG